MRKSRRPLIVMSALFMTSVASLPSGFASTAPKSVSLQESAATLTTEQLAAKLADRVLQREQFPVGYTVDLQLQALLALGDATGDRRFLEFVQEVAQRRKASGYQYSWRDDFFSSLTFDLLIRTNGKDYVEPFLAETQKYRAEGFRASDGIVSYYPGHAQVRVPEDRPFFSSAAGFIYLKKTWQPILIDQVQEYASRMAKAGSVRGDEALYAEAADQFELARTALRDPKTGLWAHGRGWSESATFVTQTKWGRAQAWLLRGLVDTLTYLPPDSLQAQRVSAILKEFAAALVKYQSDSGLWHQVVDRADSYEETSATGAISYYLARAVRQGLLPEDPYRKFAVKAIQGVQRMRISAEGDVYGGCLGTPPLPSAEDYMNRETPLNDGHAVAAVLYGAAGILLLDGKGAIPGWKESNSR